MSLLLTLPADQVMEQIPRLNDPLLDLPDEIQRQILCYLVPTKSVIEPCTSKMLAEEHDAHSLDSIPGSSPIALGEASEHNDTQDRLQYLRLYKYNSTTRTFEIKELLAWPSALFATSKELRATFMALFFGSNSFFFSATRNTGPFIDKLDPSVLGLIKNINLKMQLDFQSARRRFVPQGQALMECSSIARLSDLRTITVTLDIDDCKMQREIGETLEAIGRELLGENPAITVAVVRCSHCMNSTAAKSRQNNHISDRPPTSRLSPFQLPKEHQFWTWTSPAQSAIWSVQRHIVKADIKTELTSLTDILLHYEETARVDELSATNVLHARAEKLRITSCCNTGWRFRIDRRGVRNGCGNQLSQLPNDLSLSRRYWCKVCELVIRCGSCGGIDLEHQRFCIPKPVRHANDVARENHATQIKDLLGLEMTACGKPCQYHRQTNIESESDLKREIELEKELLFRDLGYDL